MKALPHLIFNTKEVYNIEKDYAIRHGNSSYDLMDKAGFSVFKYILELKENVKSVLIFCGRGNNGGDGYVAAYYLKQHGIDVKVCAIGPVHERQEAFIAYKKYVESGGIVLNTLPSVATNVDVVVDALLGTGLTSFVKEPYASYIQFINKIDALKIAIDVPSGLNADTGIVLGDCVQANITICMLALKIGLFTADAVDYTGKVIFEDLGVDSGSYYKKISFDDGGPCLPCLNRYYDNIKEDLPLRLKSANKGDCGKILIIAGSFGMGGASIICATGALRAGAGLIKVATDVRNFSAINSRAPELMTVDFDNASDLSKAIAWADVIAIGPGLGQDERAVYLVNLVSKLDKTVIYDADALNIIAKNDCLLFKQKKVLTPHPGEAARLLNESVDEIQQDRFKSCFKLWQKYGGVVLLKGPGSIVCDGVHLTLINEGSEAMATGGMGDMLTGIISALIGQGASLNTATVVASCVHGRAGTMCGRDNGTIGTAACDLSLYVRRLING